MTELVRHSRAGGNPDNHKVREAEQDCGVVRFAGYCKHLPDSRLRGNDKVEVSKE